MVKLIFRGANSLPGTGIAECLEIVDVGCNLERFDGLNWLTLNPIFYDRSMSLVVPNRPGLIDKQFKFLHACCWKPKTRPLSVIKICKVNAYIIIGCSFGLSSLVFVALCYIMFLLRLGLLYITGQQFVHSINQSFICIRPMVHIKEEKIDNKNR